VHIFYGDSNTCKSYLATMTGKNTFETDSIRCASELPDKITADIIVIGNRWKCEISLIKERLFGSPLIVEVEFRKSE